MGSHFITRLYESPHPYQNGGVEREGRKERGLVDEISGYRLYKADSIRHNMGGRFAGKNHLPPHKAMLLWHHTCSLTESHCEDSLSIAVSHLWQVEGVLCAKYPADLITSVRARNQKFDDDIAPSSDHLDEFSEYQASGLDDLMALKVRHAVDDPEQHGASG